VLYRNGCLDSGDGTSNFDQHAIAGSADEATSKTRADAPL
jgi:hypothetical protein